MEAEKGKPEIVWKAEKLVAATMGGRDASHDAAHAFRVRGLALTLAKEEALSGPSLEIVELAALLHDIGDYKYAKDLTEDTTTVEKFLQEEGLEESKREKILAIIRHMVKLRDEKLQSVGCKGAVLVSTKEGFKNEVASTSSDSSLEFCIVQDADRLDAIGAIELQYVERLFMPTKEN